MNWHIFLRGLFFSIPRFLVLTVLMTSYLWIDWSPIPERPALLILVYITHFAITYLFARWAFGKYRPHWKDVMVLFLAWMLIQIGLESWYQSVRTGGEFLKIATNYNWWSLLNIVVYAAAIFLAAERVMSKHHSDTPEGLEV